MIKTLMMVAVLLWAQCAQAQVVNAKGTATVQYTGSLTPQDRDRAYRAAQMASVERFFAESGEAESETFAAIAPAVEAGLDKFILGTVMLNEQDQPALKKYSVVVRTELNVAKLRTAVRGSSGAAKAPGSAKTPMAYVFIAREVAAVKSFDDRVVQREDVSHEERASVKAGGAAAAAVSGGKRDARARAAVSGSSTVRLESSTVVETGGSTTRKNDERSYRLLSMSGHKTAVTSVFSQSGFAGTDAELVLNDADLKSLNRDFSRGDDLTPSTLRAVIATLRSSQVPLLVIATFDVDAAGTDPVTGMQRSGVSVSARVLDLAGTQPREVASVPPVQLHGLGPDNASASGKALRDASLTAAREVVSRLNAAGVK